MAIQCWVGGARWRRGWHVLGLCLAALALNGCGDVDDPVNYMNCLVNHPLCEEEAEIIIEYTSSSEYFYNVAIVRDCKATWGNGIDMKIGRSASETFDIDPDKDYQIRVLYSNNTCDFAYNVELKAGESKTIPMYRRYANCPASC